MLGLNSEIALNISPGYVQSVPAQGSQGVFHMKNELPLLQAAASYLHPEQALINLPEQHSGFAGLTVTLSWVSLTGSSQGRKQL